MPQEYWLKQSADAKEFGPYDPKQMRLFAADGRIMPDSLISHDRVTWYRAARVKGLLSSGAPAQPSAGRNSARVIASPTRAAGTVGTSPAAPIQPGISTVASVAARTIPPAAPAAAMNLNSASRVDIDARFNGVFRFLFIVAVLLGGACLIVGIVELYEAFYNFGQGRSAGESPASVATFALVVGMLFTMAAIWRGPIGRSLLAFAAGATIISQIFGLIMGLLQIPPTIRRSTAGVALDVMGRFMNFGFGLTFPILCIVAVGAWLHARRS